MADQAVVLDPSGLLRCGRGHPSRTKPANCLCDTCLAQAEAAGDERVRALVTASAVERERLTALLTTEHLDWVVTAQGFHKRRASGLACPTPWAAYLGKTRVALCDTENAADLVVAALNEYVAAHPETLKPAP